MEIFVDVVESTLVVPDGHVENLRAEAPLDADLLTRTVIRDANGRVAEIVHEALDNDGELHEVWDILASLATRGRLVAIEQWMDGRHFARNEVTVQPGNWHLKPLIM